MNSRSTNVNLKKFRRPQWVWGFYRPHSCECRYKKSWYCNYQSTIYFRCCWWYWSNWFLSCWCWYFCKWTECRTWRNSSYSSWYWKLNRYWNCTTAILIRHKISSLHRTNSTLCSGRCKNHWWLKSWWCNSWWCNNTKSNSHWSTQCNFSRYLYIWWLCWY